jgi:hypothetical protein
MAATEQKQQKMQRNYQQLVERYGLGEPIFAEELMQFFDDRTHRSVYNLIDELKAEGLMEQYSRGVYYLPELTLYGDLGLYDDQVVTKKYMESDGEIFGYPAGLTLENNLSITTLVPFTLEIATNKESTARRKVTVGQRQPVILYKPRVPVTNVNVKSLMFLDVLVRVPLSILDELELCNLKKFAHQVDRAQLPGLLKYYPKKVAKNLEECEAYGVFA